MYNLTNAPDGFDLEYENLINLLKQTEFSTGLKLTVKEMEADLSEFRNLREDYNKSKQKFLETKDKFKIAKDKTYKNFRRALKTMRFHSEDDPSVQSALATFKRQYKKKKADLESVL